MKKYGVTLHVSDEVALDYGMREPTPAERSRREAEHTERRALREAAQPGYHDAIRQLDRIVAQPTRSILDLHQRVTNYSDTWVCQGCDAEGSEWEAPHWPCRTTQQAAHHYGLHLPDYWELDRPEDGSLDIRTTSDDG